MHFACGFRAVAGSVAHITRRCGCFVPGSSESDAPELTKRQAARAALGAWNVMYCAGCGAYLQGGATLHERTCPIFPITYQAMLKQ